MKVKVWNDNTHDLNEMFKGDKIHIPAKGFIEMEHFEANDYRGQYLPPLKLASGLQDPATFKMVRIERPSDAKPEVVQNAHICMSCKKGYESEPVLKAHIDTAHSNEARLEIPEIDEEMKSKKGSKKAG